MKMRQALIGAIAYVMVATLPLQAKASDTLAAQMGEARFHAAGLDQLSPVQLGILEDWLARHTRPLPVVVAPSQARSARLAAAGGMIEDRQGGLVSGDIAGSGDRKKKDAAIDSQIAGLFDGWGPGSIIVLANGQRWRVIDDSRLQIGKSLNAPSVHIAKSLFGTWTLRVKGYNTRALLEPVN